MRIGIFIDGTFIPERDGASTRFSQLPRMLLQQGIDVVAFHCYRGWSDLARLAEEPYPTYFFPPHAYYADQSELLRLVREARIDIIQMNDAETIDLLGFNLTRALGKWVLYEAHYHASSLGQGLGIPSKRLEALRHLERSLAAYVDHLIVFTEEDRTRWMSLSGVDSDRVSVVPFGVDAVVDDELKTDRNGFVFLGNMYFEPNRRAVERILTEILPGLRVASGSPRLVVVGDIPDRLRALCVNAGVTVVGEVANPMPILLQGAVGLAPVSEGSGVRAKILHYLKAGMPVVASPPAAEGLRLPAVLLENSVNETIARCRDILHRPDHYAPLVHETLATLRGKFLWPTIAETAAGVYRRLRGQPPRMAPDKHLGTGELPIWIQEVMDKGRFAAESAGHLGPYRYGLAGRGRVEIHR